MPHNIKSHWFHFTNTFWKYHISASLYLFGGTTVHCGSYDSEERHAERIYSYPSTDAVVIETRMPLKSCLSFLALLYPPFATNASVCLVSFSHSMRRFSYSTFTLHTRQRKILRNIEMCSPDCRGKYNEKIRFRFCAWYRDDDGRDLRSAMLSTLFHTISFKETLPEWISCRRQDGTLTANRKDLSIARSPFSIIAIDSAIMCTFPQTFMAISIRPRPVPDCSLMEFYLYWPWGKRRETSSSRGKCW